MSDRLQSTDHLSVEDLPRGRRTRLSIELVHDGLGRSIKVPVIVARGERDGPVFGVTAAVHGNEINGIPVIHRLLERLDLKKLRGTVVAVIVVNVPGYLLHQRNFADGTDLNHIMPGKPDGNVAQVYGHRFIERIVKQFNYLVDSAHRQLRSSQLAVCQSRHDASGDVADGLFAAASDHSARSAV